MYIKKGDNVVVLSGKDKGKRGRVENVFPKRDRAIVSGINVATKHQKPKQGVKQVGRISLSLPINIVKLALFCEKCGKGTRIGFKILGDDKKVRICKRCGEII